MLACCSTYSKLGVYRVSTTTATLVIEMEATDGAAAGGVGGGG